ncbi:uncharacterized protein LOC124155756 isoform X1 [Ischnura elegans]|uniref:uncharacterized protein LOC124155756 isoform X1 n=1 Tax=Ischnura elegans TaxID=197161 RepID=UPI001ED86D5E|nr:uncharacterized protein LOC124155756 isoform X1 [Ischnura elegans]
MSESMEHLMKLSTQNPISLLMKYGIMGWNGTCAENCSGHGECHNGTCLCEIQFDGEECHSPNMSYFVAFATVFFLVAFICLVQLVMCIAAEFQRMKAPSFTRACRVTTQKVLYFIVFLAAVIRGAYFTSPAAFMEGWSSSLLSAYYPLLLSGSSLIVCFWAEVFHLRDIRWEKPQFLSKSFLGFVTFNIINYSLLLGEFITTHVANASLEDKSFYTHVFNGCYAVLLFINVIFFLIYGVEVYFKVRGGFLCDHESTVTGIATSSRTPRDAQLDPLRKPSVSGPKASEVHLDDLKGTPVPSCVTAPLVGTNQLRGGFTDGPPKRVDTSQLHQSRFGLLAQAFMLIIIVGFLCSETLSKFWKTKVPLQSRNFHDIVFRVVEIGVALWFPCVLWNCMRPEQLWILNPKKILKKLDLDAKPPGELKDDGSAVPEKGDGDEDDDDEKIQQDCWICYDADRIDAGPLIQPCQCRGDVSTVHHDCLRRWLVESSESMEEEGAGAAISECLRCKVCGCAYEVECSGRPAWQRGFTPQHWLRTAALATCATVAMAGAWVVLQMYTEPLIRVLAFGLALLVVYVCVRFLGLNTVTAYQRAKVSALNIVSRGDGGPPQSGIQVTTISETVAVNIAPATSKGSSKVAEAKI